MVKNRLLKFPKQEYISRCEKARKIMAENGIEILLLTADDNLNYFTGFSLGLGSRTRPSLLLLPLDEDLLLIVQENHYDHALLYSWIDSIQTYKELRFHPKYLTKILANLGFKRGVLGLELDFEQIPSVPVNFYFKLKELIPEAKFVDCSKLLWKMRMVKTKREIECLKRVCEIHSKAYCDCFNKVKENMTEVDVAKIMYTSMIEAGSEGIGFFVINSGLRSPRAKADELLPHTHGLMTKGPIKRKLKKGDVLWIDSGCVYKDYHSDFSRLAFLGKPSSEQKKLYNVVCNVIDECTKVIRPGIRISYINEICNRELLKNGVNVQFKDGRIGHGIGLLTTEPPDISLSNNSPLEERMVLALELGILSSVGTFHMEENIVVTKNGSEIISKAPRHFEI